MPASPDLRLSVYMEVKWNMVRSLWVSPPTSKLVRTSSPIVFKVRQVTVTFSPI